jgi:hypothetical protein
MTAEVEALRIRDEMILDQTLIPVIRDGCDWHVEYARRLRAAWENAQAEENAKLRSTSEHCGRLILSLEAEIIRLREQIAAAAQEPVAEIAESHPSMPYVHIKRIVDVSKYPIGTKLYAAPVPAGDAVSVPVNVLEKWVLCLSQGDNSPRWEIEKLLTQRPK